MANLANIAMLAELDGAVLVDKPVGISAHDVMKAVKTRFNLVKVGHGGTLDVTATGLFVLLLGDATRFSNDFMGDDRAYALTLTLGRETDTGDRAGHVLKEVDSVGVSRERFDAALKELRGDIYQSPPAFSASSCSREIAAGSVSFSVWPARSPVSVSRPNVSVSA